MDRRLARRNFCTGFIAGSIALIMLALTSVAAVVYTVSWALMDIRMPAPASAG